MKLFTYSLTITTYVTTDHMGKYNLAGSEMVTI